MNVERKELTEHVRAVRRHSVAAACAASVQAGGASSRPEDLSRRRLKT